MANTTTWSDDPHPLCRATTHIMHKENSHFVCARCGKDWEQIALQEMREEFEDE